MTADYKQIIKKIFAAGLILLGFYYFTDLLYLIFIGKFETEISFMTKSEAYNSLYSILIKIPLPFHLMAVGLYLQRDVFTQNRARLVKFLVIGSGTWLGIAFLIKNFSLFN